jgi:hypothetical protein
MKRIAVLLLLAGCSRTGFVDSDGDTGVRDIDASGGEVKAKGALLSVPQGALDKTLRISVTLANDGNPTENVGDAFELGPTGTTFARPVTVTLAVDASNIPDPAHPELLRVAVVDNGDWSPLPDSAYDAETGTVHGTTTHFSRYGIIQICGNFRTCPANRMCVGHRCRPVEVCNDGIDNDGDGLIDCADTDCATDPSCSAQCCFDTIRNACVNSCCQNGVCLGNCYCGTGWCSRCGTGGTETQCSDGVDNDHDGLIDCRDPDCANANNCLNHHEICNNHVDDDGDGLIDCADPDCASDTVDCPSCCFVTVTNQCVPSCCQNGICQGNCYCSPQLCSTRCGHVPTPENCTNGVDDDGDGLVDCLDPDCASDPSCATPTTEQNCSDGIDNDRDGLADCRDPDCVSSGACTCTVTADGGVPMTGCCWPKCGPNETLSCMGANICGYPCICAPKTGMLDAGTPASVWYYTCGDPVCHGHTVTGVRACTSAEKAGLSCSTFGDQCDPGDGCNRLLRCDTMDPTHGGMCPISRAAFKQDITFLEESDLKRYHDELIALPLATYSYRDAAKAERPHLGFIIDGHEGLICVQPERNQVDVYGYTSMAVAALKVQQQQIEALEAKLKALEARVQHPAAKAR